MRKTPLHELHAQRGAKLVPFAGWSMPVVYPDGALAEHQHTRAAASLFDAGHMGVVELHGDDAAAQLEQLTPAAITTIAQGRQRYALLTNEHGGIIDDLMVANTGSHLIAVVNASRRETDLAHLRERLSGVDVVEREDLGLLALQGPQAEDVLAAHDPAVADMRFMDARPVSIAGTVVWASRSGYTGEDGFELLVPADLQAAVAELLLADERVALAGLAARDTLRLEAGLCLYGNDLDTDTSPVEANLVWSIAKARRTSGGFPGEERILSELRDGPSRLRVGLRPTGRKPVRDGAALRGSDGATIGTVTSGGYGPTVGGPVAMGYVSPDCAEPGTRLVADVRGTDVEVDVAALPFVSPTQRR